MNQSKSLTVKVSSTQRPKFEDLPVVGSSGWFGIYAGFDPGVKIIGLNRVNLQVKSTNKKIRYNLQRILRRESGAYNVIEGSGDLEPFTGRKGAVVAWAWGPNKLAGLPITSISPKGVDKKAVMIGQMQLEQTNVSTQATGEPNKNAEAMEFNLRCESLLTGEVDRSEDQGKIYVVAIPPPTGDDGISGDYTPASNIGLVAAQGYIEFPGSHYSMGGSPAYLAAMHIVEGEVQHGPLEELNKAGLWGEFFKLPFPLLMPVCDEEAPHDVLSELISCEYGRIGRLTHDDPNCGKGTYVMVPQAMNATDVDKVYSVQTENANGFKYNYAADAILFPANSSFAYEGVNPGNSSTDQVVDGVSLTGKGQSVGYKIHRYVDRQLKSSKSTLIPMPHPDSVSFLGGMPLELVTPQGISYMTLIRNSRELQGFWSDLIQAVVTVSKVIVDVAEAVAGAAIAKNAGVYQEQYDKCIAEKAARALPESEQSCARSAKK